MDGSVTLNVSNSIGTIEFYHPKSNSLPKALLHSLAETISKAGSNSEITVVILKSSGDGAFCAGASFDELLGINDLEAGKRFFSGFGKVILAMKRCPKLIITRVHGKTVGGGVGIVAASDYAIASENASIKLSELSVGIGPFVIAPVVERKIGVSALSSLSINATEWRTAEWAYQKGLYNDVVTSTSDLDEAVLTLADKLSGYNPKAMEKLKRALWDNTDHMETLLENRAEVTGRLALSSFTKNFIEKFKN
ncbi:MAG: enoyl-CoA hydratase/isomerase family protein [Balneola sp.]